MSAPSSDYGRLREAPASYEYAADITPHDSNNLARPCHGIYVGGAGNLAVVLESDGSVVTFQGAVVGSILPVFARRVNSTGTTATNLRALW